MIKTKVIGAFTYISEQYRGLKLSHLLRQKMFELLKQKNIKKFYFTINNNNTQSTNNLKSFAEKFKITEVAKTYFSRIMNFFESLFLKLNNKQNN